MPEKPVVIRRSTAMNAINQFIAQPGEVPILLLHGQEGVGKTTVLYQAVSERRRESPRDVNVLTRLLGVSTLVAELVNWGQEIANAIQVSSQQHTIPDMDSYLVTKLYGSRHIDYEVTSTNQRSVVESNSPDYVIRQILEGSERTTIIEVLDAFGEWLQVVLRAIDPGAKFTFYIDVSESTSNEELRSIIDLVARSSTATQNLRAIFALSEHSYGDFVKQNALENEDARQIEDLELAPFDNIEKGDYINRLINSCGQSRTISEDVWSVSSNIPLDIYFSSTAISLGITPFGFTRPGLIARIFSQENKLCQEISSLLAIGPGPLLINDVVRLLGVSSDDVERAVAQSFLIETIQQPSAGGPQIDLVHSSVIHGILGAASQDRLQALRSILSHVYEPTVWSINTYQFYALHPLKLVFRLNLLRRTNPGQYIKLLTSGSTRVLLRQWAASKFAKDSIQTAIIEFPEILSPGQKSLLYRDLGYFLQLDNQEQEANNYFHMALEILGVSSELGQIHPREMIQAAEALIDQADFHRKQANYGEAINALVHAKAYYESLLETDLASRLSLEKAMARVAHNIGITMRDEALQYRERDEQQSSSLLKEAIDYFEEALAVETLHDNPNGQVAALSQIALINAWLGIEPAVKEAFSKVTTLSEVSGDLMAVANLAGNLASIYLSSIGYRTGQAQFYAQTAYNLFRSLGAHQQQENAQRLLDRASKPGIHD